MKKFVFGLLILCLYEKIINGNSKTLSFIVDSGDYNVVASSAKASGKILVYYKIENLNRTELDRLERIDGGDLDNPPEGNRKAFSVDLKNKSGQNENVYKFTLEKDQAVNKIRTDGQSRPALPQPCGL